MAAAVLGCRVKLATALTVNARGSYDVLLGQDWLYRTRNTADFGAGTYKLGGGGVLVRQWGRQLEVLPFSAPLQELKELANGSTETSSSDGGEADDVLQRIAGAAWSGSLLQSLQLLMTGWYAKFTVRTV